MVFIGNFEKFFDDHPEYSHRREEVMRQAHAASRNGIIMGDTADQILGDLADVFFPELAMDVQHLAMSFEDIQRATTP